MKSISGLRSGEMVRISRAILVLLVVVAIAKANKNVQDPEKCETDVCKKLKPLCDKANETVTYLSEYIQENQKKFKKSPGNCQLHKEVLGHVIKKMVTFMGNRKRLPGRKKLNQMPVLCDDYITTLKGVYKKLEYFKEKSLLDCRIINRDPKIPSNKEVIRKAIGVLINRILRCGFGPREYTEEQKKEVSSIVRSKRHAIDEYAPVENELEEIPNENSEGIEKRMSGTKIQPVTSKIFDILRNRTAVGARTTILGYKVTVDHKCECTNEGCKCCLVLHTGKDNKNSTWSACMGFEMLEECQQKGIKIYFDIIGLKTEFSIMEGASSCVNIPKVFVSVCIEPYGFHFCPRKGTFRTCLQVSIELLGFKVASLDLNCLVLAKTRSGGTALRLRKSKDSWRPPRGALNVLFSWISDIVSSQYGKTSKSK